MDSERTPSEAVRVAVQLAQRFHETYERLAPSFGYETRAETKVFDPESPNGKLMIAVCAALSLHVGDAAFDVEAMLKACVPGGDHCDPQQVADALRAYLGATPAGSGSAAYRPEPQSVSALRAPIPGAERAAFGAFFEKRWPEFSYSRQSAWECWQGGATWGIARGMEARQGRDPQGLDGEATTARSATPTRPEESRAQPFLHIEPAPGHRWIQATMEEWDEVQRIRDAATTPTEGPAQLDLRGKD